MQWTPLESLKCIDWLQFLLYAHLFAHVLPIMP
jgi:hypothetical protein